MEESPPIDDWARQAALIEVSGSRGTSQMPTSGGTSSRAWRG
jgi:hypothetical protein